MVARLSAPLVLLISCVQSPPAPAVPDRVWWPVTLVLQNDDYSCATTSVAMALGLDQDQAWAESGGDPRFIRTEGHDIPALERLAALHGHRAEFADRLGLDQLKRLLAQGRRVVLFVQPDPDRPQTHAVLAVGYNDRTGTLKVADPAGRRTVYGYEELARYWKARLGNPAVDSVQAGLSF